MRNAMKWVVAGSGALGVAALMTVGAGAVSGQAPGVSNNLAAAHTLGGSAGADAAAIAYVNTNYSGSGVANVLATAADTEAGVPVYDVSIVAPNGFRYIVHVQQSNDTVLSANLAEKQVPVPPVTVPPVTVPPVTVPPVIVPPVTIPTSITPSESVETESNSGTSTDVQKTGVSSNDTQDVSATSSISTTNPGGSSDVSTSAGTQGSPSSSSDSGDHQGVGTSSTSGSSNSSNASTTNSDS